MQAFFRNATRECAMIHIAFTRCSPHCGKKSLNNRHSCKESERLHCEDHVEVHYYYVWLCQVWFTNQLLLPYGRSHKSRGTSVVERRASCTLCIH